MARLQLHTNLPDVSLDVIIPEYSRAVKAREAGLTSKEYYANRNLKVLWLLHGGMGNSTDWLRYSKIELYAEEKGIVVVCPSGDNGCYVNAVEGDPWEDVITEKLWELVNRMFPVSDKPEDNYIAGLSMGGYGSLRLGLLHPDRYSRIGAFSAGTLIPHEYARGEFKIGGADRIFGDPSKILESDKNLRVAAKIRKEQGNLPPIYMSCGRNDHLYEDNVDLCKTLKELGYDVTWDEGDFRHEWRFWDQQIEKFIATLPD